MPLSAPIVLVHGLLGFGEFKQAPAGYDAYFRGVRDRLAALGNIVPAPPSLDPTGSIANRAERLREYLDCTPDVAGRPVHLIAHSMGGLDSPFLIARLGLADRVLSLTTIGTPHRGSPIADFGVGKLQRAYQKLRDVGLNIDGFGDLTTAAMSRFNDETPDAPGVRYFSIAGRFEPSRFDLLKLTHDHILRADGEAGGPNDGLVSVASATWGTMLGVWPENHLRLVNWVSNLLSLPRQLKDDSVLGRYEALIAELQARGCEGS